MSRQWLYGSMLIFAGGLLLRADSLSLRSGKKVDGTFLGANIASLILGNTRSQAPPESAVIPAGTTLRVPKIDAIDVDGTKAGAAKVEQGGKFKGSDLLQLKVLSIKLGNKSSQVVTSLSETKSGGEGKTTGKKVLGAASLGAIVGGIAGGGQGAGIGALAGVTGGTIISATGEPHLKVPPETRLEFQLTAD